MRSLIPFFPILVILLGLFGSIVLLEALQEKIKENEPAPTVGAPPSYLAAIAAQANLAQKLGIQADEIQVISSQAVDWPDSSLGCPQPGYAYAQVITPGFLLLLEAGSRRFEYHTSAAQSAAETAVVDCTTYR